MPGSLTAQKPRVGVIGKLHVTSYVADFGGAADLIFQAIVAHRNTSEARA